MSATAEKNPVLTPPGTAQYLLGWNLMAEQLITETQLEEALARQKSQGGRLGENLIDLGFITLEEFKTFLKKHPHAPRTVQDTGLEVPFIAELALKHILSMGEFKLADLSASLKLTVPVVDTAVEYLRRDKFVEVKGAPQYSRSTYRFIISGPGEKRARELLEMCCYAGPAPVSLDAYRKMVISQTVKNIDIDQEALRRAFSHLVVSEKRLKLLGPAIASGKSIFLYGPPGNGKTSMAEAIGKALDDAVYIPYAIYVGGEIISVFDPINHIPVKAEINEGLIDKRWLPIKRPVIMTGGELTLETLDLEFNPVIKYYQAPLQVKANNGLFIIDDFGREQIEPKLLLNRWIVPLERRVDFMTLHTGMKFEIPFDQLVIFCTNLEPENLVEEAFLRRIRYKIQIGCPTEEEFEAIFVMACEKKGIAFDKKVFDFLKEHYYRRLGVTPDACDARDLVDYIIDSSRYYHHPPEMSKEVISDAWETYFFEKPERQEKAKNSSKRGGSRRKKTEVTPT